MPDPYDVLEASVLAAHPEAELLFFGAVPAHSPHVLNGAIVAAVDDSTPYWVIVSQGFTELGEKASPEAAISGLGFELVARVPRTEAAVGRDFGWVLHWFQGVADVLHANQTNLDAGHTLEATTPATDDEVCSMAFVHDPVLQPTRSRNGASTYLQLIGLRAPELAATRSWNVHAYVELLRTRDPHCLIDTTAPNPLADPGFQARVTAGIDSDGSALGVLSGLPHGRAVMDGALHLVLREDAIRDVLDALERRLSQGRPMVFVGTSSDPQAVTTFLPSSGISGLAWKDGVSGASVYLDAEAQEVLTAWLRDGSPRLDLPGANLVVRRVPLPTSA